MGVCGCAGRGGARLRYPWIVVTSVVMVLDLVATGLYAADAAHFVVSILGNRTKPFDCD